MEFHIVPHNIFLVIFSFWSLILLIFFFIFSGNKRNICSLHKIFKIKTYTKKKLKITYSPINQNYYWHCHVKHFTLWAVCKPTFLPPHTHCSITCLFHVIWCEHLFHINKYIFTPSTSMATKHDCYIWLSYLNS